MYWRVVLAGIYDATIRPSHGRRRFWLRVRNRLLPWFFWSY